MALRDKLENLPLQPGVYLFKNAQGRTIYIGKAKSLRHRVRSYFQESRARDYKTEKLVGEIADLECIVTDSELEALILESNLIKENKPSYNVLLRDDKNFPYIKLTVNEPYPRAFIVRKVERDGALYFGPFLPASLAREMLKLIEKYFLIRNCDIHIDGKLERPCLDYYIKRCLGPCVAGLCTKEQYDRAVQEVKLFLEGRVATLVESLERKMAEAAERQNFELAAYYRDSIARIRAVGEKQKMILHSMGDADIFGYKREGELLALEVFTMRAGKVVGRREFFWEDLSDFDPSEFMRAMLQQYYHQDSFVPAEIVVPVEVGERELLEAWLSEKRGEPVRIFKPEGGEKRELLSLVEKNAAIAFQARFKAGGPEGEKLLEGLKKALMLDRLPRRIECFDISNIQGSDSVGSVVVCDDGEMNKSEYRRFAIKTVRGADDFASIHEVVSRRYRRLLDEGKRLPDLVLIDGGVGQLGAAARALDELGLGDLPLAAIAKREELIYLRGRDRPLRLDKTSPLLRLIQRVRDEAHRFALSYHRKRREMRDFASALDEIPGVGPKRKEKLLRNFGSLDEIKRASVEELRPYVGEETARRIAEHFRKAGDLS